MVVNCEECGLKYQIDLEKISGDRARFKCKGCAAQITVDKYELMNRDDLVALEEALLHSSPAVGDNEGGAYETGYDRKDQPVDEAQVPPSDSEKTATTEAGVQPTQKKSGIGLTTKVIFLMLVVSLLPGAVYFALSFKQSNERIVSETNKTGSLVTNLLSAEVDEWIDKNTRMLKAVAKIPSISAMNQFDQEIVLKSLQAEYPWMYLVFTTDERGMNVARSDGKSLKDYSNRQYVQDVAGGSDLAWQNLIGKTSKKPSLVLAVPIKKDDTVVGVLAAAMTRDALSKLVTTFRQGATGRSFLVDQNGKAVAHQDNAFVIKQQDMSTHPLVRASHQSLAQRVEFKDANGKETIGFARKTKLGWTLAIQQEKNEAFMALKKAQLFAYSLLAVTVVVIILISFFASRAIVTPIRKLTDAANRISVGDLEVEIINRSKDEIGDLADAVMRMQDSIRLSIAKLQRRKK